MNKQQISHLVAFAVAGLTAGLSGCGGASGATEGASTPGAAGEKHGCKGEPGDKHGCGAGMKDGTGSENSKADAPTEPAKGSPADADTK